MDRVAGGERDQLWVPTVHSVNHSVFMYWGPGVKKAALDSYR